MESDRHETIDSYWMTLHSALTAEVNKQQWQVATFEDYKKSTEQA
jgi:hypothetical protein